MTIPIDTKLNISKQELTVIKKTNFFLHKHSVTKKIFLLFLGLQELIKKSPVHRSFSFTQEVDILNGKISKGENYYLFPWIVLDYPKYFNVRGVFAFRTKFWWGNFFSFTLHLSGNLLNLYRKNILKNIHFLYKKKIFFCVNNEEWEHHFEETNYLLIDKWNEQELRKKITTAKFIKLSRKIKIDEWKKVPHFGKETYEIFLQTLL